MHIDIDTNIIIIISTQPQKNLPSAKENPTYNQKQPLNPNWPPPHDPSHPFHSQRHP